MSKAPSVVDKHVGQRLRNRRIELGMSQDRLATELGLTFQQIQKYEKGTNRIGAGRLHEVARILDTSIEYFFDNLETVEEAESTPAIDANDPVFAAQDVRALAGAFAEIRDAETRRRLLDLVRALRDAQAPADAPQRAWRVA
ncbi:MAG: helix-turn-helix domain-containing protein [Pseudomonadota bacterium]